MTNLFPTVILPIKTSYGKIDEICNKIAAAAQWGYSPNCSIEMAGFSFGGRRYQRVHMITDIHNSWRLWFARAEGNLYLPNANNVVCDTGVQDPSGILKINIPLFELTLNSDPNQITLHHYVGENWQLEKWGFMESLKTNGYNPRLPRQYLLYRASLGNNYVPLTNGSMPNFLAHTTDNGLQYDLQIGDPASFPFRETLEMFAIYLQAQVCPLFNL